MVVEAAAEAEAGSAEAESAGVIHTSRMNTPREFRIMSIRAFIVRTLVVAIAMAWAPTPSFADQHEFRFQNGSSWRGDDGDAVVVVFSENGVEQQMTGNVVKIDGSSPFRLVVIKGDIAGGIATKAIFESDIVSMSATDDVGGGADAAAPGRTRPNRPVGEEATESAESTSTKPGVFLLPWEGTVGIMARHDEIEAIAAEADKHGPGQIIVLEINSPGGLVMEGDKIHETLMEVKKRHRVVAWIKKAISAGAFTALHCDEIYFMKVGAMGSAVMFAGQTSISGPQLDAWVKDFGDVAEAGGRSRIPAECMITRTKMASYDKDPDTGRVTWYPDMRGEFRISDDTQVLTLNAENAMHSDYIDGIADTTDELAVLLDMAEWHEISDEGRRIHRRWKDTVEACKEDVPRILRDLSIKPEDQQLVLLEKLLRWYDRCEPVMLYELNGPGGGKEELRRAIERLRRQRAQQRRN